MELTKEQVSVITALHKDLVKTWPALTLEWMLEEGQSQVNGARPKGSPGTYILDYLKKIKTEE